jgi:transcription termination factor NusB
MGAGILPATIHNGKLYFLFGKENKYEDSAPGYSDFGGGKDNSETYLETAIREGAEELTGFLGNYEDIKKLLKKYGTYNIDYNTNNNYRMHIFPILYDPMLPIYYNNNQKFIHEKLDPSIIKSTKIFEKAEIKWICVDDIIKSRSKFRSYFQNIVDMIYTNKNNIKQFVEKSLKTNSKNKTNNKKTNKNKTIKRTNN